MEPISGREYERRRKAQHNAAIAEGRDPEDFRCNERGEILYGLNIHFPLADIERLINQHRCECWAAGELDLWIDVPEVEVERLLDAIHKIGLRAESYGRLEQNGVPEGLN
jgi:hypothetical protein